MQPTFSPTVRRYHDSNVARLERIAERQREKERERERLFNEHCKAATNRQTALRILVREAVAQYRRGYPATSRIPVYLTDARMNAYRIGRTAYFRRARRAMGEELQQDFSDLLRTFVDCRFELAVEVGYFKGSKAGFDDGDPTIVSLQLFPDG